QSLGILRAVNCADSKGKESGENSRHGWIGIRAGRRPTCNYGCSNRRISSLLRRYEACCRRGTFQTSCETGLAVNYSADVAGAVAAQRLAASATECPRGNIVVCGAVHTNLLYVVTDTTGRSGFNGS